MPANQQTDITTFTAMDDEWWTPPYLIRACRTVLGQIDLDPASSVEANTYVKALNIYTREDNGLSKPWSGTVFLNPPSRRGDPTAKPHLWAYKLAEEYSRKGGVTAACLIVKSVLGYKWYEFLYTNYWCCHLKERPAFIKWDGTTVGMAKKGVTVFLLSGGHTRIKTFFDTFLPLGKVVPPAWSITREMVADYLKQANERSAVTFGDMEA